MDKILFFDLETDRESPKLRDIGAVFGEREFHQKSVESFAVFAREAGCICGHNILRHDLPLLRKWGMEESFFAKPAVDTLYLSALLFPEKPYHKLVKDYKLYDQYPPNNPVWDARLAAQLFADEVVQFFSLPPALQAIYYQLLSGTEAFSGFFPAAGYHPSKPASPPADQVRSHFEGTVCRNAGHKALIRQDPVAYAYALAIITTREPESVPPPWLIKNYPQLTSILYQLRVRECPDPDCTWCREWLDPHRALESFFGYRDFRRFSPEEEVSLQELTVRTALRNDSLLGVFPTGGGKSLAFQLPALMTGRAGRALTVVISPLQSLMKDQVDVLRHRHGLVNAVTINGLLSPLERSEAIERVMHGDVHLLYISPESLRSRTVAGLLKNRSIARFVVDEAHCFSAWGQDFRVDYLYIGEFIANLCKEKGLAEPIPVSCFTATARPQVIDDICDYFRTRLSLQLQVFIAPSRRVNLTYTVQEAPDQQARYRRLKGLLSASAGAKIIYVSRVRTAEELAGNLNRDGFEALPYHGQMETTRKIRHQDQFIRNEVDIIVATTAFGMGVDKKDVGMVIHYEISGSLENYVQEAGRAGRSEEVQAGCFILFDEEDLGKHFELLNRTRINRREIGQIWQAIRKLTRGRGQASRSALEIARAAGWDREMHQVETRVTAAIAALEDSGFVKRGHNAPRVIANSFREKDISKASEIVRQSAHFSEKDREHAIRIIQRIIKEDETRVDHLSEVLAIAREDVMRVLNLLRQENIIGDAKDLTAFLDLSPAGHPERLFSKYARLEKALLKMLAKTTGTVFLKEVNGRLQEAGLEDSSVDAIKDVLLYWETKSTIYKTRTDRALHAYQIGFRMPFGEVASQMKARHALAGWIAGYLAGKPERGQNPAAKPPDEPASAVLIQSPLAAPEINVVPAAVTSFPADAGPPSPLLEFSLLELKREFERTGPKLSEPPDFSGFEEALLYLNAIGALKLEGGFLIIYNPFTLERLEYDNGRQYSAEEYRKLETHYSHKVQQIHIVGEYARKMLQNYHEGLAFVDDYFTLDYDTFLEKYFPDRQAEIRRPLLPRRFRELFGNLSSAQLAVVRDTVSPKIVVTAGPGSGKTRVLAHKVASLLLLEDIRPEQFLMLTFSRAAALEFRERLRTLVKGMVHFLDIHTCHSYCFNLLGRKGTLEKSEAVIAHCLSAIRSGTIPAEKLLVKSVLVVDEFQDISENEFALIRELTGLSGDMRVIVAGDEDQNIYEFRGSATGVMQDFGRIYGAKNYQLSANFRSRQNLVQFANGFLATLRHRAPKDDIYAATAQNGFVRLVSHQSGQLVAPLAADVKRLGFSGTTAVLTHTNEEALLVENCLRNNGVPARLILSAEGFCLGDLLEIRHFSGLLAEGTDPRTELVPDPHWLEAREKTSALFAGSDKLWLCLAVADQFSNAYPLKYLPEWHNYLKEIRFEDFYYPESGVVLVSTMHKAKGKEFDTVFLLLENYPLTGDARRRTVYVALTRAKQNLIIHTNGEGFAGIRVENMETIRDTGTYEPAREISFHLCLRDLYLNAFRSHSTAAAVTHLQAGQSLTPGHDGRPFIELQTGSPLRYSRSFEEVLNNKLREGYRLTEVAVNFQVYWRDREAGKEYPVLLPRLRLVCNG